MVPIIALPSTCRECRTVVVVYPPHIGLGPWFRETLSSFQLGRPQLGLGMTGEGELFGGYELLFPFHS